MLCFTGYIPNFVENFFIMKKLFLLTATFFICSHLLAQDEDTTEMNAPQKAARIFYCKTYESRNSGSYDKGTMLLSLTYGAPNLLFNGDYSGTTLYNNNSMGFGPIMLRAEMAVRDEMGIAVFGQVATKNWSQDGTNEKTTGAGGGAFILYHFNKLIPVPKLDVYAGLGIGIRHDDANFYYTFHDPIVDAMAVGGVRYYFTHTFGIMAEAGFTGYSYGSIGVTFRMEHKMHHKKLANEEPRVSPGE